MGVDDFLKLGQLSIETAIMVCAPILVLGLVVGLVVSIFQAATQISDSSIAFIPKIGASIAGLIFFGHFMMNRIAEFTTHVFNQISTL